MLNTSHLTDLYIVFILKIESVSKTKIFGLKMTVKSGLEKIFLKFLAEAIFPQGGKSEIFFFAICTRANGYVRANILLRFQFEGKTDVWISQVRHVKLAVIDCFPTYCYLTRNFLVSFRIRSLEIDRLNHKSFSSLFLDILSLFGSIWWLYSENKVPPQRVDHKSSFAYGTLTFYWKKDLTCMRI